MAAAKFQDSEKDCSSRVELVAKFLDFGRDCSWQVEFVAAVVRLSKRALRMAHSETSGAAVGM